MQAVVCYGPRDYRIETLPKPRISDPHEILCRVLAVGICAGDSKCYQGAAHFWSPGEYGESYCEPPIVPGHEFVCELLEMGEAAQKTHSGLGLRPGDWLTAEQLVPCTTCRYCVKGAYNMCMPHTIFGFRQKSPGAMAEFMLFPKNARIHKIPRAGPFPQGAAVRCAAHWAFTEPLACAIHAVNRADVQPTDIVVVSGCGPIGVAAVAAARRRNPKLLVALDMFDWKLDIAKKAGADVLLNPGKEPPDFSHTEETDKRQTLDGTSSQRTVASYVRHALCEGFGCDKYIEAAGHPSSVTQGLEMIARQGVFVEYAVFGEKVTADWTVISDAKELEVRGGHLSPGTFPEAIEMLRTGLVPVADVVTHRLRLEDFAAGLALVEKSAESCKVVLEIGG